MTDKVSRATVGLGLLLVISAAVMSGVSNFVNIYAVAGTSSDAFVTARNLLVALLLVPVAFAFRPSRTIWSTLRGVDWARLVTIGLIGGAIPFLLFFRGVQLATAEGGATTASFFYRTLFLMATVFAVLYLKERFHWRIVAGAALLLGGSYLLLSLTSPVWTDGTIYVLVATVLWAGEYTLSKRTMSTVPGPAVALGRMGFGALFLSVYLVVTAQWGTVVHFSGSQWAWVGISGALLSIFVTLWYAGLSKVDLGVGSSVLVLGYPVTWLLSIGLLGSKYTLGEIAGTLAIVVGIVAVIGISQLESFWSWLRDGLPLPGRPTD